MRRRKSLSYWEYLDTVGTIVGNEDLHHVVGRDTVRKLQVPRDAELVQDVAPEVEYDDGPYFALDDDNAALTVNTDSTVEPNSRRNRPYWLNTCTCTCTCRRSLRRYDVPQSPYDVHAVGVVQLAVLFAAVCEAQLEPTLSIEGLDAVPVGVSYDYVSQGVDSYA